MVVVDSVVIDVALMHAIISAASCDPRWCLLLQLRISQELDFTVAVVVDDKFV
jgi:hypothetical protein